jgi:hypothetical protein
MRRQFSNHSRQKWWVKWIRTMNWFSFRYYWFVWLLFLSSCFGLLFWLQNDSSRINCDTRNAEQTVSRINEQMNYCCGCNNQTDKDSISHVSDSLKLKEDSIPKPPSENCGVHFTGLVMGGYFVDNNISKIYKTDAYSEYVGSGFYPKNTVAFPKSVKNTFDGIAIDKGTHLIIYSKPNFKGRILLDAVGPKIINNVIWKNDSRYDHCNTDKYPEELQKKYPQKVRTWSNSNMHKWSFGSCKIFCE